jgi:hypothetical protein
MIKSNLNKLKNQRKENIYVLNSREKIMTKKVKYKEEAGI